MPKEEKTVDIDTTGPGAEVNVEEDKKEVEVVEPVKEEPVEEKKEEVKKRKQKKNQQKKRKNQKNTVKEFNGEFRN